MIARRDAVLGALLLGAFLVLVGFVRVGGKYLATWRVNRLAGESYVDHTVPGRDGRTYQVHLARGPDVENDAKALADTMDTFITSATAPPNELQLRAPDGTVRILIFENHDDYKSYGEFMFGGKQEYNGGFYSAKERTIGFIRSQARFVNDGDIRHETAHMLLDRPSGEGLPPWLNEGLACWFETAGSHRSSYIENAAMYARDPKAIELRPILTSQQDVFTTAENKRVYSLSAALVTWLLEGAGPDLRRRFLAYYSSALAGGGRMPGAFEAALETDLSQLEKGLADWLTKGK